MNREMQKKRRSARDEESQDSDEDRMYRREGGNRKREREESPDGQQGGAASSSGGSHLMSEAEVQARLKKGKKSDIQRGSVSAAARIQREMAEWEANKAKNPEFWKPPKF